MVSKNCHLYLNKFLLQVADTTLCLILNLYRRTYWLANMVSTEH